MNDAFAIFRNASWLELGQFAVALFGLGFSMWGLWHAAEDAVYTDSPLGDIRRFVALGNLRAHIARVSANGILVYVGIVSVLLPPPPAMSADIASELEQAALVRVGLVMVTLILSVDAVAERRHRYQFLGRIKIPKPVLLEEPES